VEDDEDVRKYVCDVMGVGCGRRGGIIFDLGGRTVER
jgi:hypothetical protein